MHHVTVRQGIGRRAAVTSLAVAVAALMLAAQTPAPADPHDPAPWACSPTDRAHPCACHRVDVDPMCESAPREDAKCKRYCEPTKCHCPIHCKES